MTMSEPTLEPRGSVDTWFAPPERAGEDAVREWVQRVAASPVLAATLELLGGWICVLNRHRQILAVNHAVLEALGVEDPSAVLGLRPGEALRCVHAPEGPGGCGTSRTCASCGAVIAMVAVQQTGEPQERDCVLTFEREGTRVDRDFVVRCCPFEMDGQQLLLICMRDISEEKRRAALERTFLHDLSNLLTVFGGSAALLDRVPAGTQSELLRQVREAAAALSREVRVQRMLSVDDPGKYPLDLEDIYPGSLLRRIESLSVGHPAGTGQSLQVRCPAVEHPFRSDPGLLTRVLTNMVVNAFEAGGPGDFVTLECRSAPDEVEFRVWNRAWIPEPIHGRIFQKYFSTKPGGWRGLGTYSMKLIGESLLGGKVSFQSSPQEGTTFTIRLPAGPPEPAGGASGGGAGA